MTSRVMKVSRNTVRAALISDAPPRYERRSAPSIVDEFEPWIRELLQALPIAQNHLWFPGITLPVGFAQVRTPTQLPVLTMVCGYCHWLSELLIPSRRAEDLFAGWW